MVVKEELVRKRKQSSKKRMAGQKVIDASEEDQDTLYTCMNLSKNK